MKTSQAGLDLIKHFEGLVLTGYLDPIGIPTVGWGHTRTAVHGETIPEERAEELLRQDLAQFETCVISYAPNLNQHQFDALVSFCFNVGCEAFRKSTLLKEIQAGRFHNVPFQLSRWNRADGQVFAGLTRRRAAEADLFMRPVNVSPIPSDPNQSPYNPPRQITPAPVRKERDKLGNSRTVKAGGSAVSTGILAVLANKFESIASSLPSYADDVLFIIALLLVLYMIWCRRDDWLRSKT